MNSAYDEGREAHANGEYTNPYPLGSRQYFQWQDGYDDREADNRPTFDD